MLRVTGKYRDLWQDQAKIIRNRAAKATPLTTSANIRTHSQSQWLPEKF
jgi:hypothetical protein